ncbi:MAG: MBOAT family protein [Gammaproteobacteria bacterium]|nr:MAG: MBOAT family protein [Gammaproteobacteria bacterium]RLA31407.1 MAG: MBOAT family protein [Gammaproteobacteria bacterium]
MLFNSLTFIAFFILVLALHNAPLSWTTKKTNLLIASYLFYAAWNPPFVILLWISTVIDWHVAKKLFTEQVQSKRKVLLAVSVVVNLGLLGYFKYGGFLMENFQVLMSMAGIDYQPPDWSIVLPVGISFYTFQTMAYSLDVYLRRAEPSKSFLDFALFVTFFPQLVAGPIVRPTHLLPQFATPRVATRQQLYWGLGLMTIGLFQKIVVADGLLAPASDAVFGATNMLHPVDAWLGTLAFSGQIFSDFAGYSTTAIGVALTLGFGLPDNFRYPYAAIGFSDFWRRWHISLSTWLRDYLYIPLGGNRKGNIRTYANLMTTMLLGGLWHGASWTFVVWGGLHGVYLAAERWLVARLGHHDVWNKLVARVLLALLTYFLINITWVFFRAPDFTTAWRMITTMLTFVTSGEKILPTVLVLQTVITTAVMLAIHWWMRNRRLDEVIDRMPVWLTGLLWGVMLMLIIITQGGSDAFIYFQF